MDFVRPRRPVALSLVSGRGHYDAVIQAVLEARLSIWIATANLKELLVEDPRAAPGRRRGGRRGAYRSVLEALDELVGAGVELRLLHAGLPSLAFVRAWKRHPRLGLALRTCPRLHFKAVVVDGALLYLGSANWTGAGLGAKGAGRRNFELGVVTDDTWLLDEVQAVYDRIWRGGECGGCKLRTECGAPLDELISSPREPASGLAAAPPNGGAVTVSPRRSAARWAGAGAGAEAPAVARPAGSASGRLTCPPAPPPSSGRRPRP